MSDLADLVGLVGLEAMLRVAVLVRIHRDGADTQFVRGAKGADRDFTTVGDENFVDH
jgi:hypothetical protein